MFAVRNRITPLSGKVSSSCQRARMMSASAIPSAAESNALYDRYRTRLSAVRESTGRRALTLTEKIVFGHLEEPREAGAVVRGSTYLKLRPDRVAMQDASGQMALLQFISSGLTATAVPATMHCDHLIVAHHNAKRDLTDSIDANRGVFEFLRSACAKYGIGFWRPGSGIIHQIVLENYALPGSLLLGTDSHSPNGGGLGMLAIGVGGADAVDVMAGMSWEVKAPRVIGVHLTGQLKEWVTPKDVILRLAQLLTVKGGTGAVLEYFGSGVATLSATGMATITNMGAEVGATSSVFPYTKRMSSYLRATRRGGAADRADALAGDASLGGALSADANAKYDQIIELDLSSLEPRFNGPFTPDKSTTLSDFKSEVAKNKWPDAVSAALIGSCTNSSYEDMSRCAALVRQASEAGLKVKIPFLVTPGSEQIRATIARDGFIQLFESVGATVLANACGPCIGQWTRTDIKAAADGSAAGKKKAAAAPNSILTSYNRNFPKRNDGHATTHNFVASPELVTAMAFSGSMNFNPLTDSLTDKNGRPFKFRPPTGDELPVSSAGFDAGVDTYEPPLAVGSDAAAKAPLILGGRNNEGTDRLQLMSDFPAWNGADFNALPVLIKVKGQCTTDHISPAGPWLAYRGHLDNLSNNTLIGAISADSGKPNSVVNQLNGQTGTVPDTARAYKKAGLPWLVIGEENYGEGSARESAALQPRHLGGVAVIAHSFARIHETNLKKQGMLPLTFTSKADYDKIKPNSRVSIVGLTSFAAGKPLTVRVHNSDKSVAAEFPVAHTFNASQIEWFKAGSALNAIKNAQSAK